MSLLDISIINNYIKNYNSINVNNIQDILLSQSKSCLKILSIPYLIEGTNMPINSIVMEAFIKLTYIFDNIKNMSKLCIVKISLKSNITIAWINIWESESGSATKLLINCCFNISSFIATIHSANMNPSVLQCKNCWRWDYTTFVCYFQETKCLKCNGLHKVEHHHHFA